jgi:hypothetical protein
MAAQSQATLQVQQQMQAQFQQYQKSQGDPWGDPSAAGGTEAADAPAPDDDLSDVHIQVWMPRSALSAVRDAATSATDHCPASGRPDCTSTSCRWVHERPSRDLSTVTTPWDRDVRGTLDDDTTCSGHFYLSWPASNDHSDVVTAAVSTHHRSTCLWDASSHHSAQSTGVFTSSELHYTTGRGFGSGGLLPACYHRVDLFSNRLRPRSSRSRGHSGSDFRCRDDYSSTSSTSSGSGFLLSDLVTSQRGLRQRWRLRLLRSTFEDRLYLTARSFLSASALDTFLVLVAKGGDRSGE